MCFNNYDYNNYAVDNYASFERFTFANRGACLPTLNLGNSFFGTDNVVPIRGFRRTYNRRHRCCN